MGVHTPPGGRAESCMYWLARCSDNMQCTHVSSLDLIRHLSTFYAYFNLETHSSIDHSNYDHAICCSRSRRSDIIATDLDPYASLPLVRTSVVWTRVGILLCTLPWFSLLLWTWTSIALHRPEYRLCRPNHRVITNLRGRTNNDKTGAFLSESVKTQTSLFVV